MLTSSASAASDKYAVICGFQRANDTEPEGFSIIGAEGTSTENNVHIGGYFAEPNAATSIQFRTAANTTTRSGSERARIDSSGRLLVGTSSTSASARLVVQGNSTSSTGEGRIHVSAGTPSPADGTALGRIIFTDNGQDSHGARIDAIRDGGTWTTGASHPTRLVFTTASDGSATQTERLRITSTGVLQIADAGNIAVGTTTGTKIGTATTQKLGFFNKTPVVQPTAVADATDAASVITQLNALLSRMRDLGLIAT
jgi:hypothetical protein